MKLSIYIEQSSPRLTYIFQTIFEEILGISILYIYSKNDFKEITTPKISYSTIPVSDEIWFPVSDFILKKDITPIDIQVNHWQGFPVFFEYDFLKKEKAALPFDPFSMSFYLLSRYEEYTSEVQDAHSRFPATESLAFKNGFLNRPLIDELAFLIKKKLLERYPNMAFPTRVFQFTPTYDIDYAWSYLHKGFKRTLGGIARDFLKNQKQLFERFKVIFGQQDPYFTFDYLDGLHQEHQLSPIYFFLVGEHGTYDKNISIEKKQFQQLIQRINNQYKTGLHPSYQSNANKSILKKEQTDFQKVIKKDVQRSRQHFLKLSFPETYQRLINIGIQKEYSMGYAEHLGFRASIARPFQWFDLSKNEVTNLQVYPFQIMDVTLKNYLKLSPEAAKKAILPIIQATQKVNGHLITIWHNNSFCEQEGWEDWRAVYEKLLEL
jgi:hypothetical protein